MHRNTKTTATEWRDDDVNIEGVRELNRVYERIPFSREYEGVLDLPPLKLEWSTGANLPVAWKGGVAGSFGDTIVLAAGMWMPDRLNVAYAYDTQTDAYTELPPCPVETQYTQGTYDDSGMYVVGGRAFGRQVWKLTRHGEDWKWTALVPLPSSEIPGRWLAGCGVVSGRWLCLVSGTPGGKPSEQRDAPQLQDWKLLLNDPNAEWEPMSPYPLQIQSPVSGFRTAIHFSLPDSESIALHDATLAPPSSNHSPRQHPSAGTTPSASASHRHPDSPRRNPGAKA